MVNNVIKAYGYRGKGFSARNNSVIKAMKAAHLLSAIAWGGGALSMQALNFLRLSMNDAAIEQIIARCAHFVDSCVVMPGLAGCVLTGLFYSLFTSIGFFRYAWIGFKWLVALSAAFWGTLFWGPWGNELIKFMEPYGLDAPLYLVRGCLLPENMWQGALQTCIILTMCLISVYRPLSFRPSFLRAVHRVMRRRIGSVYSAEKTFTRHAPQNNVQVNLLYRTWLGKPLGEKSLEHLHAPKTDKSEALQALRKAGLYPRPTPRDLPGIFNKLD